MTPTYIPGPAGQLQALEELPEGGHHHITAILCHPHPLFGGTMDNKVISTFGRACAALGVACVRFNYRGVGESSGIYGEMEGEIADCKAVIDWVRTQRPDDKIWLMGFSFGSYIAIRNAIADPEIAQLVTVAPSVEHADFESLPSVSCPWLIVMGDQDEIVPSTSVFAYAEHRAEHPTLVKMLGATHFFHGRLVELKTVLTDYLERTHHLTK